MTKGAKELKQSRTMLNRTSKRDASKSDVRYHLLSSNALLTQYALIAFSASLSGHFEWCNLILPH